MTYIVLINWNGWSDTIECLESLLKIEGTEYRIIVCDNGSEDESLEKLQEWANGRCFASAPLHDLKQFSQPLSSKPIQYHLFDIQLIEQIEHELEHRLTFIDCRKNLGFAAANNVAIRLALKQTDMNAVWLLNNDTVIRPDSLLMLEEKSKLSPGQGMIGSTIYYYHEKDKVQAYGGARYFPSIGLAMHIGRLKPIPNDACESRIEKQMSYVMGAAMYVTRDFIETIGLMSESYFLYYEEIDWALRAKPQFSLGYASKSIVYHKAGASIKSSNKIRKRDIRSDYYLMKNRIKVTQRFFPHYMISVKLFLLLESLYRISVGRFENAMMILKLVFKK